MKLTRRSSSESPRSPRTVHGRFGGKVLSRELAQPVTGDLIGMWIVQCVLRPLIALKF